MEKTPENFSSHRPWRESNNWAQPLGIWAGAVVSVPGGIATFRDRARISRARPTSSSSLEG